MNSAFVAPSAVIARPAVAVRTSSFASRPRVVAVPVRRAATISMAQKIPQGFTSFSEQLNGRAAMMGFILAVVTEALTGKGIVGQVSSIFENVQHLL